MTSEPRKRGGVRRHGNGFQIRVSAGVDPSTGDRIVLHETVPVAPATTKAARERTEREARRQAEKILTRLQAEADELKVARTKATLEALLAKWLPQHEIDETTRMNYAGLIRNHIKPALGDVPLALLIRNAPERLEGFYAQLRRCKQRCAGRPFVEAHKVEGRHDCRQAECRWHQCRPLATSSVRQIHGIISSALGAAFRWGWIPHNPAPAVRKPALKKPRPQPPAPPDMARIVEAAWQDDEWWGLYLWLSAVTGGRRGEIVALRWDDFDLDRGLMRIDENYAQGPDGLYVKDPKDHQVRYVSLDKVTVDLVRKYKAACAAQLLVLGVPLDGEMWVFSAQPDSSRPRDPSAITRRYTRLVKRLGVKTELKQLRHYSATELLTSGTDLRTVSGRLGHADASTTLRYYAAWIEAADKGAAETIAARMPQLGVRPLDQTS